jgi:hypothetical protein
VAAEYPWHALSNGYKKGAIIRVYGGYPQNIWIENFSEKPRTERIVYLKRFDAGFAKSALKHQPS